MIAHISYAEGSPCPTLVLDAGLLPEDEDELRPLLTTARRWLEASGATDVLKIALISQARHPLIDLDYRFVQCLPGRPDAFDFRGSCGHSIVASVLVASRLGWLPKLSPESRVRVNVLNNGDYVVCEVDEAVRSRGSFTVHFLQTPPARLGDLLLTSEPVTTLDVDGRLVPVSLVSTGNPYVFVEAATMGIADQATLFADDPQLFARMSAVKAAAARALGWPEDGAFPKVAAIGQFRAERLSARAISVPRWHPTLALTGVTCLGTASAIEGTIPQRLARRADCQPGRLAIDTPGGPTAVTAEVSGTTPDDHVRWASVTGKRARLITPVIIEPLRDLVLKEAWEWLPLAI